MTCGTCTCHNCLQHRSTFTCPECNHPMKTTEVVKSKRKIVTVAIDSSTTRTDLRKDLDAAMNDISFVLAEIYAYRSCPSTMKQAFYNLDISRMAMLRKHPQPSHPVWTMNASPIQPLGAPSAARKELAGKVRFAQTQATWDSVVAYVHSNVQKRFGIVFPYQEMVYILWVKEVGPEQLLVGGFTCCTGCGTSGTDVRLRWCKKCRSAAFCTKECAVMDHQCSSFAAVWSRRQGSIPPE